MWLRRLRLLPWSSPSWIRSRQLRRRLRLCLMWLRRLRRHRLSLGPARRRRRPPRPCRFVSPGRPPPLIPWWRRPCHPPPIPWRLQLRPSRTGSRWYGLHRRLPGRRLPPRRSRRPNRPPCPIRHRPGPFLPAQLRLHRRRVRFRPCPVVGPRVRCPAPRPAPRLSRPARSRSRRPYRRLRCRISPSARRPRPARPNTSDRC